MSNSRKCAFELCTTMSGANSRATITVSRAWSPLIDFQANYSFDTTKRDASNADAKTAQTTLQPRSSPSPTPSSASRRSDRPAWRNRAPGRGNTGSRKRGSSSGSRCWRALSARASASDRALGR